MYIIKLVLNVGIKTFWYTCTVGENIIATTKIRNNHVKLSLLILFASFLVSVFCFFFDGSLSKVIALPTSWKSDNYMGSNTEKKPTIAIAKLEER